MTTEIYRDLLLASIIALYIYGFYPFFTKIPKNEKFKSYDFSHKIFSISMIIWASYFVIHWLFNFRSANPIVAAMLNLSCYYIGGNFIEIAFSSLIVSNYPKEKRIRDTVLKWIAYNIVLILSYFFAPKGIEFIVIGVFSIFFVFEVVIILSIKFFKRYKEALNECTDDYHKENVEAFVKWIYKSVYYVITLGVVGGIAAFSNTYIISIYLVAGCALFTYIFFCYQNFFISISFIEEKIKDKGIEVSSSYVELIQNAAIKEQNREKYERLISENFEPEVIDNRANDIRPAYSDLEKALLAWINNKGYVKNGLTIVDLAEELNTNRTYLSNYIKKRYNLSFREWITYMRIEYAKKLLIQNESLSANKIAEMVGYTHNGFATIFAKCNDNISPTKWRNLNKNLN